MIKLSILNVHLLQVCKITDSLSPFTEVFVDQGFYILCQVVGWDLYCMSIRDSDCGGRGDFIFSTHASD